MESAHSENDDLDDLELYGRGSEEVMADRRDTAGAITPRNDTEMEMEGDAETAMPTHVHTSPGNHSGVVMPENLPTAGLV